MKTKIPMSAMYGIVMETSEKATFSTRVDKAKGETAFPGPTAAGRESMKTYVFWDFQKS